jgi:hypothetical protein
VPGSWLQTPLPRTTGQATAALQLIPLGISAFLFSRKTRQGAALTEISLAVAAFQRPRLRIQSNSCTTCKGSGRYTRAALRASAGLASGIRYFLRFTQDSISRVVYFACKLRQSLSRKQFSTAL